MPSPYSNSNLTSAQANCPGSQTEVPTVGHALRARRQGAASVRKSKCDVVKHGKLAVALTHCICSLAYGPKPAVSAPDYSPKQQQATAVWIQPQPWVVRAEEPSAAAHLGTPLRRAAGQARSLTPCSSSNKPQSAGWRAAPRWPGKLATRPQIWPCECGIGCGWLCAAEYFHVLKLFARRISGRPQCT